MSDLPGLITIAEDNTASIVELNPSSLAVLLYALDKISNPATWKDTPFEYMSDADIETIHELVDLAADDIMRPLVMAVPIGSIMFWLDDPVPDGWLWLDGGSWLKTEYPDLYAHWGGKYGETTDYFNIPNMKERSAYGAGNSSQLDSVEGSETHTLTASQIPAHVHQVRNRNQVPANFHTGIAGGNASIADTVGTTNSTLENFTTSVGGNAAHNNLHPVYKGYWIVYAGQYVP